MADRLRLEVVTPSRRVLEGSASEVRIPGALGELGILPGHTPLLTSLGTGLVQWTDGESSGRLVVQGRLDVLVGHDEGVLVELIEIADRPNALAEVTAALTHRGLEVRGEPGANRIEVLGTDADLIADSVRDAVADAHGRVGRIVRRRRRLEDLFEGAQR